MGLGREIPEAFYYRLYRYYIDLLPSLELQPDMTCVTMDAKRLHLFTAFLWALSTPNP